MRLPYMPNPPPFATGSADAAVLARVQARRAPRPLQPLDLALLHSPAVADGWNAFLGAVRARTGLPAAVREAAIARVAALNGAWYEWAHHAPLAREAGVTEAGMEALRRTGTRTGRRSSARGGGGEGGGGGGGGGEGGAGEGEDEAEAVPYAGGALSEMLWAVVRYTDEMTRDVRVSDEAFEGLKRWFGEKDIVELTATVAAYNCVSRFLVALDVGEKNDYQPN